MRIRQVRPEFWTDETMAALAPAVRLFYIGLWNIADDAGWMEWRPTRIGAVLFPYETAKHRERNIAMWGLILAAAGRLVIEECGCAQVPTLSKHQRVTGRQSFSALEAHRTHLPLTGKQRVLITPSKQSPLTDSPVTLGNVTERNAISVDDLHSLRDVEDETDRQKLAASGSLRR